MDSPSRIHPSRTDYHLPRIAGILRSAAEVVVFVLCFLSVWPFGCVDPQWEYRLALGMALLALLWGAHGIVVRRFLFRLDLPTFALGGLLILSVGQLIPLPIGWVRIASPTAARLHEQLQPASLECLPGETASVRSASIPLSVDPEATRNFAVRLAGLLVVYAAVRNWLATRESLKRMAWGGMVVGAALSLFAIGQFFAAPPHTVYWVLPSSGSVFGPFINRNHYADYIALCMGWTIALLLVAKAQNASKAGDYADGPLDFLTKPVALAAAIGLGLMALSVVFSLSRGGLLAVFLAALGLWFGLLDSRIRRTGRIYLLLFVAALGGGILFFGIAPLENRVHDKVAADDRIPLWRGAISQVPGFALVGSGNGSFPRVEPLARPQVENPYVEYTNAHNEYVEALLEGGILRLGLTAMLAFAVAIQLGRAYRRRSERIVGPYLLGLWFGLFAVAAHAFTDFGIHVPAIAVFATVSLAHGMAAAQNPEFGLYRKRHRKKGKPEPTAAASSLSPEKEKPEIEIRGAAVALVALLIAGTGVVVALDLRNYARFYEYWLAGKRMGRPTDPALVERKIALLNAAALLRPQDSTGHLELGKARVQGARDISLLPLGAVVGSAFPRSAGEYLDSPEFADRLRPGLADLRTTRNLSPLYPETQLLLGQHAKGFSAAEPALTYFERAKMLNRADPNIWYACGQTHFEAGNDAGAAENWRRSLELSPQQLPAILAEARTRFAPADLLARVLPDNPDTLVLAAEYHRNDEPARRAILERAAGASEKPDWTWKQRSAAAEAADMLGRTAEAETLWNRAMDADPQRFEVRDGFSRFLEREERYEEAQVHLNWLIKARPGDTQLRDRSLAAKHGIDLNEALKK